MSGSRPWWDDYPEVLQREEAALEHLGGQPPVLNRPLLEGAQVRQYTVPYPADDGSSYELTVTFSDLHPYFRVEVTSGHVFGAHQHPFLGALCLLRGGTAEWDVGETAADMIAEQMPKVLADRTDADTTVDETDTHHDAGETGPGAADEAPGDETAGEPVLAHVEPYVNYYTYEQGTVVRVDGSWPDLAEADYGTLVMGLEGNVQAAGLRAAVLQVLGDDGTVLREAHPAIAGLFTDRITGRWVRLSGRPPADGGSAVLEAAAAEHPPLAQPAYQKISSGSMDVVGVIFADDIRADLTTGAVQRGDVWAFVVRGKEPTPLSPAKKRSGKGGRGGGRVTPPAKQIGPYLVRGLRAGRADMTDRVPTLRSLSDRTVALFGAGGVGAPSAVEFAKAGLGKLHLVDRDYLDPGNAARWPTGYAFAGHHKLQALAIHLAQHWPYTELAPCGTSIGGVRLDDGAEPQWETFSRIVADSHVVYDATAEPGINYFLSELAHHHGVPYVVVAATEGGWGGYVARFHPEGPCWTCLMHHFATDPNMLPPVDPDPATKNMWAGGCTDPTFTGTGFDVATIALAGVRLTAATLCGDSPGGYPPAEWHYGRYAFRTADRTLPGTAEPFILEPHPDCNRCRIRTRT